ncbi:hypothetical protein JK165_03065 [Acetobacter okinawensis]|uniref:hypothetical protein n=1 Tax=Acetobacter okinawensis TaxID=1076594 RepID=UPI001BA82B9C|nr:hypothetical protein [Acetobacter okinawensis]MBS0965085.1 hypothetical protein [Acetobacter okinawensis]
MSFSSMIARAVQPYGVSALARLRGTLRCGGMAADGSWRLRWADLSRMADARVIRMTSHTPTG